MAYPAGTLTMVVVISFNQATSPADLNRISHLVALDHFRFRIGAEAGTLGYHPQRHFPRLTISIRLLACAVARACRSPWARTRPASWIFARWWRPANT